MVTNEKQPKTVTISVRELVEFIMRSGSIDNRYGGLDRALEGARIHRRLQKAGGENYQAEVSLSLESPFKGYTLLVEGRADGIIRDENGITIDEIKTTGVPLESIHEDFNALHWAQAMCYGHMYCLRENLDIVQIRLTYYQVETSEIKRFIRLFTANELETFYADLLARYQMWSDMTEKWQTLRDESIKSLPFPFEQYRKGQRTLAVTAYKTIRDNGKLFCQAPTGIGKTISTLFPAVKAIGEGISEKIFYLTAKTITRQVAENACHLMRQKGVRLKTVTLTAKDKICFQAERNCNPDVCTYADGHFDRVNDALYALLNAEDTYTREIIEEYAQRFHICPFELALDLSLWSDCIIADYNHAFDPQIYLRRFFANKEGNYVFLVDEAHNLVDRAREMFSAGLHKSDFLQVHKALDKKDRFRKAVAQINTLLLTRRKLMEDKTFFTEKTPDEELQQLLIDFIPQCEEWLQEHPHAEQEEAVLNLYFNCLTFIKIAELYDDHYTTILQTDKNDLEIRLFCLDPSHLLQDAMKRAKASILFSATLTPLNYFQAVLGGDENSITLDLPSPFRRENLCLLMADNISTKYKDRQESLAHIVSLIGATIRAKKGNYMVYFPSYAYMQMAYEAFIAAYPAVETILQQTAMEDAEKEAFLQRFDAENAETLVGFCVMGGIYSEGIDLQGDRLIGSIIVGVGLPQINPEQDVIRQYYNQSNGSGFAFAYQYPGMNKVLQAAGRVIRGEEDRGVVLLIDERFTSLSYRPLLPRHWYGYQAVRNEKALSHHLALFWQTK